MLAAEYSIQLSSSAESAMNSLEHQIFKSTP